MHATDIRTKIIQGTSLHWRHSNAKSKLTQSIVQIVWQMEKFT